MSAYTAAVDSLKALDPNRPIREADIVRHGGNVRFARREQRPSASGLGLIAADNALVVGQPPTMSEGPLLRGRRASEANKSHIFLANVETCSQ